VTSIAILVGNTEYRTLTQLGCCHADLIAIDKLLRETGKYETIRLIENADADSLKLQLRTILDELSQPINELFFYFTGHGHQGESDFFFCTTNFNARRPNETGLSTFELHTLLRVAKAELLIKVVDACNSGTLLIKSSLGLDQENTAGFRNIIQISSCLESQESLTGNPLSEFTDQFIAAALRKNEGPVYYSDIINTLRDEFNENDSQTPFFVSQGTGREKFVDDAKKLDQLRLVRQKIEEDHQTASEQARDAARPPTLLDRLRAADAKVVTPEHLRTFVNRLLDSLAEEISDSKFAEFFDVDVIEHAEFREEATEKFIIKSLSNERRADNFVTASHTHKRKNGTGLFGSFAMDQLLGSEAFDEQWNLSLNCEMERAQMRFTFTPKFINLQRIVLIVSCAPSLDRCYLFELVTQHRLHDFGKFDTEGSEISRRWWKLDWFKPTDSVVSQISTVLLGAVENHLVAAEKRMEEIEAG
jgi:hypothetical protein